MKTKLTVSLEIFTLLKGTAKRRCGDGERKNRHQN
jgi:hypothetical protein